MSTKIEWCDETINPIVGCSKVSAGCENCYAEEMARRLAAMGFVQYGRVIGQKNAEGYRVGNQWNGETCFAPSELKKPSHWKRPRRIFIGSMGDIFHETVWRCWLDEVLAMVIANPQHKFMMLTKRPQRMKEYFELSATPRPPENLWLGVTVEAQDEADSRIPILLGIPAAVRFLSVEPMLGPVDLSRWLGCTGMPDCTYCEGQRLQWVICGGENGHKARAVSPEWVRALRDQTAAAGVPFFFKGWGRYGLNWLNDIDGNKIPGSEWMDKTIKRPGRMLDGKEHMEVPSV